MSGALIRTNVLVLGKTGAGKSSLINYLYGLKDKVRSGAGAPVTSYGLHPIEPFAYRNLLICPYDSWGLEEGAQALDWERLLHDEMQRNGQLTVADWFHSLIYCLDASRSRLDDYEKDKIITPFSHLGCRMIFVLTKCDKAAPEKQEALEKTVREVLGEGVQLLRTGSVSETLRSGRQTQTFGREELLRLMGVNLRDNLILRLQYLSRQECEAGIAAAYRSCLDYYDAQTGALGIFTHYGDELKARLVARINEEFGRLGARLLQTVTGRLDEINAISSQVLLGYAQVRFDFDPQRIGHLSEESAMPRWRNDFQDYLRTLTSSLSVSGLLGGMFTRRNDYRRLLLGELVEVKSRLLESWEQALQSLGKGQDEARRQLHTLLLSAPHS